MKKIAFLLSLLFVICNSTALINAQQYTQEFSTQSKKAAKAYEQGCLYMRARNYDLGLEEMLKAVKYDPGFVEAYLILGDIYSDLGRINDAIATYNKAIQLNTDFFPDMLYIVAVKEMSVGEYQEAKQHLLKYQLYTESITKAKSINRLLENCEFAISAMQNPVSFSPVNLGPGVNSQYPEYFPCLTVDDKTLLFTRKIKDAETKRVHEDFYISEFKDGQWTRSRNVGYPINTLFNEGAPTLSPNGRILIFTACEYFGDYGPERRGKGSCDLFFTQKIGDQWTAPRNMGVPINTGNWETQPSYSSDGKTLYFVRGHRGSSKEKGQDIWMTEVGGDGYWTEPVKLSDKINTPGTEESVYIHPDGQTLYFSSNGHPGMGGLDLFVARKDENGEWGEPMNLGYPINTWNDENSLLVSGDGKLAYFASDREGGYGDLDLYYFELEEKFRPQPLTYMKGKVFDKENRMPLSAKFELIDLKTGNVIVESNSDQVRGEFLISIPTNRNYALNVSRDGYLFYSDNFTLEGEHSDIDPFLKDVPLQRLKVGEKVILKNIFFDTDKFNLKGESRIELNKLIELLTKNPGLSIELGGHTDNVGGKEYNQSLSEKRARAVYDYLVQNDIDPERLSYKGYGLNVPVDTNDTPEGRANNRRTEFLVTGR